MKETKLHHQQKFLALGLAISKILCNFTSLKLNIVVKQSASKDFIRKLYRHCTPISLLNGAIHHIDHNVSFSDGKGNALFMFAKVNSQPFNGFIV